MIWYNNRHLFSEAEMLESSRHSRDMYEIGMTGFEQFYADSQGVKKGIENFINRIGASIPEIAADLKSQRSIVMEQTQNNIDSVLQAQASTMASMSGGPVGHMMKQITDKAGMDLNKQLNQGRLAALQEHLENKKLYYDVVGGKERLISGANNTLSQLVMNQGAQNTRLAQVGMQGSIDAGRALIGLRLGVGEQEIKKSQQRLSWYQSNLSAESSLYGAQMHFMTNAFTSMSAAEVAKYDTDVKARQFVYGATAEANAKMFNAMMMGRLGVYQTNVLSRDKHDLALQQLGFNVFRMNEQRSLSQAQALSDMYIANAGMGDNVLGQFEKSINRFFTDQAARDRALVDSITKAGYYLTMGDDDKKD